MWDCQMSLKEQQREIQNKYYERSKFQTDFAAQL